MTCFSPFQIGLFTVVSNKRDAIFKIYRHFYVDDVTVFVM